MRRGPACRAPSRETHTQTQKARGTCERCLEAPFENIMVLPHGPGGGSEPDSRCAFRQLECIFERERHVDDGGIHVVDVDLRRWGAPVRPVLVLATWTRSTALRARFMWVCMECHDVGAGPLRPMQLRSTRKVPMPSDLTNCCRYGVEDQCGWVSGLKSACHTTTSRFSPRLSKL